MRAPGLPLASFIEPERLARMAAPATAPPWTQARTNNYGFLSAHDYPYAPPGPRPLVVGIFGGSVAQWFALQGAPTLGAALRAAPSLRDRDIVVLNFAAGGYKQPQQLLLYNYLLAIGQRIDVVVNIGGFNEVALAGINVAAGTAASMPSVQHMGPLAALAPLQADSAQLDALAELGSVKRRLAAVEATTGSRPFALGWLAARLYARVLTRRAEALAQTLAAGAQAPSLVALASTPAAGDAAAAVEPAAELWRASTRLLSEAARARQARYLEVLQPNQYFGGKPMDADEAKIARNAGSVYRPYVEAGYPKLLAAVPALRDAGVAVLDATALFGSERAPVYADDCCHYNQRGNDLLAHAIAEAIVALPAAPAPPAGP
jgi:hypothetical protein